MAYLVIEPSESLDHREHRLACAMHALADDMPDVGVPEGLEVFPLFGILGLHALDGEGELTEVRGRSRRYSCCRG